MSGEAQTAEITDRSTEAGQRFYRKVQRIVRRQQKANSYKPTTIGAVAEAAKVPVDTLVEAMDDWHGYWISYSSVDGKPKTEWPCFEEGE